MFTRDQLAESLKKSNWPALEQQKLLAVIPKLGPNTVDFLCKEIDTFFSEMTADVVVNAVEKLLFSIDNISQNPSDLILILRGAADSPDFDFGRYVIPVLADARQVLAGNKSVEDAILEFELKVFKELPESELQEIVHSHLLFFMGKLNVLMEFKRINFLRRIGEDKAWGKEYVTYLENNQELFSKQNLAMEGKNFPPQVKHWIRDFVVALPVPVSQRTTFEEVQYLKRSPNASKLSIAEQEQLLEIIKLYRWFLDPFVTEEEVTEYEQKLNDQLYGQTEVAPEPEVPKSQGFGFKKPMADIAVAPSQVPPARPPLSPPRVPVIKPPVMPPLKTSPVSVQEMLNRKNKAQPVAAPPPTVVLRVPAKQPDVKKTPINTIADILQQKQELEKKIDEKIQDLKKRTKV